MVVPRLMKYLAVSLVLILGSVIDAASVTIDRNTVRVNETFELTVNLTNQPGNVPDMSALPKDLEVMGNNNFYRRSIINGRTTQQSGWRFTIRANNEGIFTIPAIQVEGTQTEPVTIKVLPAVNSAAIDGQEDALKLTSEIDLSEVYVQQQIVYTIRLYRSVQAQYATLSEPQLEGALIESLGDDIQYDTVIDATPYRVLERKYAIFPQESGNFEISGVVYTAEVSSGNRRFSTLGSLRGRNRSVSLTTNAEPIVVKPIPNEFNDWWLPAKQVELVQDWSSDTNALEVGSPVTWTYTIQVQGLTATQIPEIKPEEVKGLKFYPEQAVSENAFADSDVVSSRTQRIAVIPTQPGDITVPEITVPWWNVKTNQAEMLIIPSKTITVNGSGETAEQPLPMAPPQAEITPPATSEVETNNPEIQAKDDSQIVLWQIATATLAIFWLITLLWRAKSVSNKQTTEKPVAKPMEKPSSLNDVKRTLNKQNVAEARKAIISYVRGLDYKISSLEEIIRMNPDSPLSKELRALDKSIYGNAEVTWQAEIIEQGLQELTTQSDDKSKKQAMALPPLHPE